MSIVPYRASDSGRIVYHDPNSQILVVHNNHNNSVELYENTGGDLGDVNYPLIGSPGFLQPHDRRRNETSAQTPCCPNCGVDLADFLDSQPPNPGNFPHGGARRTSSGSRRSRSASYHAENSASADGKTGTSFAFSPASLRSSQFMHRDYFDLLAELPFDADFGPVGRALEGPQQIKKTENVLPSEIFNQGYFQRFFRKIPPAVLGSGAHAQVYKVAHVLKGIQLGVFAVKRINVGDQLHFLDQVLNEVLILYELSAQGANDNNLIRYNHVWMEYGDLLDSNAYILNPDLQQLPEKVPYVYILQQYCDGGHLENLVSSNFLREESMSMKERIAEERLRRRGKRGSISPMSVSGTQRKWLSDLEIWKFFHDILNAVAYLHAHGILHRDLKPSNCLLESKYEPSKIPNHDSPLTEDEFENVIAALPKVLVSDFGEGKFLNKKQEQHVLFPIDEERRGNTGTLEFTDPKLWIFEDVSKYEGKPKFAHQFTYDSDIYSLGMILCYLCVGKLPFADHVTDYTNPESVRNEIASWHAALTPETFNQWFDEKTASLKGKLSPLQEDFRLLIYSMIKGSPNTAKPSPKTFIECLDSIKWRRFILQKRNRSRSGATIVEMNNEAALNSLTKSGLDEKEEIPEDEIDGFEFGTIDLTDLEDESTVTVNSENIGETQRNLHYKSWIVGFGYILNLILLEAFASPRTYILFLKLGNVTCLALENLYYNDYRMQLVGFWFILGILAILFNL